jgi:outer membrane protein insertion porin family
MLRLCLFAALAASLLPAQQPVRPNPAPRKKAPAKAAAPARPASTPDRWPLASIAVTGNKIFPSETIVRVIGLKVGDSVSRTDLERAIERLQLTGGFETLSFRYTPAGEKMAVTFEVQEVIDLYPVGFDRMPVPEADLVRHLGEKVPLFGPTIPATGRMVERVTQEIESYLAAHEHATKVIGHLAPTPEGRLVMTFRPEAGAPSITFVAFEGSQVLRDVDLQAAFYQTAVGEPYSERRLTELLDSNIRPLFEEKGRLRVRFGPYRVEESESPVGVKITVPVEDGEEFQFGSLQFPTGTEIPARDLSRLVRLEEGNVADFSLVKKALADIESVYRRNGFMHEKSSVERTLHDDKKTVDLQIRIQEGNQFKLRNLAIKGLDLISEAAVRKRWGMKVGQPYDASYPEVFVRRIQEEEMFESLGKITHREILDEEERTVDVELVFLPAPPRPRREAPPER